MRISRRAFLAICLVLGVCCVVACPAAEQDEFRFVQMCDTQFGMGEYEHDVETFKLAVEQINALKPDFVLICGDLVDEPEDDHALEDFNAVKVRLKMPCYCAPGNHHIGNSPTVDLLERYRSLIGKDYYSFEHKGYAFVVVNTQLWKAPIEAETAKQDEWLERTLRDVSDKGLPVFVVGHHPLYLGEPDEPETYSNLPPGKREELLALFDKHGVVAVLSGHVHRNIISQHNGIQLVATASTSRNFDGSPMGFRVWRIGKTRPYAHEYVPVEGAEPPGLR